jgi:hypothetical protein
VTFEVMGPIWSDATVGRWPSKPRGSYLEQPFDGEMMRPLRESLTRLLEAHEPNPALIVDGLWNLIEANQAASLLWDGVDPELLEPPINMLRLAVHPGGLPKISSMTAPATQPVVSLNLRTPRGEVSLFTVIATLGAPLEVSAANLAIETFLPMDERSAARLRELSAKARGE